MSLAAGLLLEWVTAEILPMVIMDVGARAIQEFALSIKPGLRSRGPNSLSTNPRLRVVESVRVLSRAGGRVRLEVVGLKGNPEGATAIESRLRAVAGVHSMNASWVTGKVLIEFDEDAVPVPTILVAVEPQTAFVRSRQGNPVKKRQALQLALGLS